jgi:glycosyltransferase involved in cell wall biosynthesis
VPVKVIVLTNMLPAPDRQTYGIFVRDQIEDLEELGVDVTVLFINGSERRSNYLRGIAGLRRHLSSRDFDLIHAHYGLTGAVAITQRQVPVVTTFHGSDCEIAWQRVVSRVVARRCEPVFVSQELAMKLGCEGAAVIPAGVDLAVFQPVNQADARRKLGWPANERVALLPGSRSNAVKNPALFDAAVAEARRDLPDLRGESLEGLSREQVALTINACDVLVMTSTSEGSPVTVKEALACGTPVVSVPVGDVESLVEGLLGCAVVARDPTMIGRRIVEAVSAKGHGEFRARVAPFSREAVAIRLVEVYERAVAEGLPR